jgi:dimethylargininase
MNFTKAITRKPGGDFAAGITSVEWEAPPDYDRVCRQHRAYVDTLVDLGLEVALLEDAPGFPDAYFVEDTAVILGDTAVLTRPGAQARMGEVELMAPVVACHKNVVAIRPPGLLDGGDVMLTDDRLFIGLSQRTNAEGARQLGREADRIGLPWSTLPVLKALHLKSGVNYMGRDTLLLCDEYVQRPEFMAYDKLVVAADELPAANTLAVNGSLLTPRGYPATRRVLNRMEMPVIELDVSEVIKMDGGLSCLSLRFR